MPLNKEATLRYQIIDECLCNRQKPFPSMIEIIAQCSEKIGKEFSVSTIQKDIKDMKEDELLGYMAPIKFSKSNNGYYYADEKYTIRNIPLSNDEIDALEIAAGILEQFRGSRVGTSFNTAVEKVLTSLKIKRLEHDKKHQNIIQQETAPYAKGYEKIDLLLKCIKERTPVSFVHYSYQHLRFSANIVHPYLLKEHRNRWYLVGFSEVHNAIRLFGLDRMEDIYLLDKPFYQLPNFKAKELFQNTIGVFVRTDKKPTKIVLQFNNQIANYIKSQPIHETQEVVDLEAKGGLKISIKVFPTWELTQLLLSYGKNVFVISPLWLRQELIEEYETSLKQAKQKSKLYPDE